MKKYIYIFITWLLRDTKDINLNVSFIKWLHPIFFLINGSFWPKTQDGKHTVGCPAALQSMKGIRTFPINSEKEKITNFLSSTIFSCVITYTQICQSSPRPQVLRQLRLKGGICVFTLPGNFWARILFIIFQCSYFGPVLNGPNRTNRTGNIFCTFSTLDCLIFKEKKHANFLHVGGFSTNNLAHWSMQST